MNLISQNYNENEWDFSNNSSWDDSCMCKTNCLFLESGKPKSTSIQVPVLPGVITSPITVDTITVDTSCFYDSKIQLNFTININSPLDSPTSNLNLNVFKLCNNRLQSIPAYPQWSYNFSVFPGINQIFNFFIFDCNTFKYKECTYILQASSSL